MFYGLKKKRHYKHYHDAVSMAYNPPIGSIYHLYTTYILPSGEVFGTEMMLKLTG